MLYLQQAETKLEEVLEMVNDALTADYVEFRRNASALDLEVMKEVEALSIEWRR